MVAALYLMRCHSQRMSVARFASEIGRTVQFQFARSVSARGPNYSVYKNPKALEQDLRRGLEDADQKLTSEMMYSLIWWRFSNFNPSWGFYVGGGAHLQIAPKNPRRLISWIDGYLDATKSRDLLKAKFAQDRQPEATLKKSDS